MKKRNQQKGVVLLTCLVFLLVLLGMLRFTLNSSKMDEIKTGIDVDLMSAREAAQSALSEIERQILIVGRKYCEYSRNNPSATDRAADVTADTKCEEEMGKYANIVFRGDEEFLRKHAAFVGASGRETNFYGIGLYIVGEGAHQIRKYDAIEQCVPLYLCVNWGDHSPIAYNTGLLSQWKNRYRSATCTSCNTLGDTEHKPRFIIERFRIDELNPTLDTVASDKNTVILRVTAMGYGRGGSDDEAPTSAMLQATYLLPAGDL